MSKSPRIKKCRNLKGCGIKILVAWEDKVN